MADSKSKHQLLTRKYEIVWTAADRWKLFCLFFIVLLTSIICRLGVQFVLVFHNPHLKYFNELTSDYLHNDIVVDVYSIYRDNYEVVDLNTMYVYNVLEAHAAVIDAFVPMRLVISSPAENVCYHFKIITHPYIREGLFI
jgi:hypothetical protein